MTEQSDTAEAAVPHEAQSGWFFGALVFVGAFLLFAVSPVLAAMSPLLQAWYWRRSGREPYRLYAVSNAGSLGALLSYPVLIEPRLALRQQAMWWSAGYALVAAASVVLASRSKTQTSKVRL